MRKIVNKFYYQYSLGLTLGLLLTLSIGSITLAQYVGPTAEPPGDNLGVIFNNPSTLQEDAQLGANINIDDINGVGGNIIANAVQATNICLGGTTVDDCKNSWDEVGGGDIWQETPDGYIFYNAIANSNLTSVRVYDGETDSTTAQDVISQVELSGVYFPSGGGRNDTRLIFSADAGSGSTVQQADAVESTSIIWGDNYNSPLNFKWRYFVSGSDTVAMSLRGPSGSGATPALPLRLDFANNTALFLDSASVTEGTDVRSDSAIILKDKASKIYVDTGSNLRNLIGFTSANTVNIGEASGLIDGVNVQAGNGAGDGGYFRVFTNGSENFRVDGASGGFVGIGTGAPQSRLHVFDARASDGDPNNGAEAAGYFQNTLGHGIEASGGVGSKGVAGRGTVGVGGQGTLPDSNGFAAGVWGHVNTPGGFGGYFTTGGQGQGLFASSICLGSTTNCISSWPTSGIVWVQTYDGATTPQPTFTVPAGVNKLIIQTQASVYCPQVGDTGTGVRLEFLASINGGANTNYTNLRTDSSNNNGGFTRINASTVGQLTVSEGQTIALTINKYVYDNNGNVHDSGSWADASVLCRNNSTPIAANIGAIVISGVGAGGGGSGTPGGGGTPQNLQQVLAVGNDAGNQSITGVDDLITNDLVRLTGTYGSGSVPPNEVPNLGQPEFYIPKPKLIWYPKKAAFRVGSIIGEGWDDAYIGDNSTVIGTGRATARHSTVVGFGTVNSGLSVAIGGGGVDIPGCSTQDSPPTTNCDGFGIAIGSNSRVSGKYSVAIGPYAYVSGVGSIAFGMNSAVTANNTVVFGTPPLLSQVTKHNMFVIGDKDLVINSEDSLGYDLYVNGTAAKNGGGSWTNPSDIRLKDVVSNFSRGLSEILALNPINYFYKKGNAVGADSTVEHVGLVAQEVEKVIPESITKTATSTDGNSYLMLNNDPIIFALINAVKEQQAQIEELKEEILDLRKQIEN